VTTIFTPSIALNFNNDDGNITIRQVLTLSGASLGQMRMTFQPNSAGGVNSVFSNLGIGKATGTQSNTTAAPIEITFGGGGHGLNLTAGSAPITSDWINVSALTLNSGDKIVITSDNPPSGGGYFTSGSGNSNSEIWQCALGNWNVAAPSGQADNGSYCSGIASVETQSGGAAITTRAIFIKW